jgi:hypothetical protein
MDQLAQTCGQSLPERISLLGGNIEEQQSDGRYRARVRLWRTERTTSGVKTFYRFERLDVACSAQDCQSKLTPYVVTWMGQLLEETVPTDLPVTSLDSIQPPYCQNGNPVPAFLCAPFNLAVRCDPGSGTSGVAAALLCPFEKAAQVASCDCTQAGSCEPAARVHCTAGSSRSSRTTLQKGLAGGAIAAGVALVGVGLLLTLNNHTGLTLRSDTSCSFSGQREGKCYVPTSGLGATWGLGLGLVGGGALILVDPLHLFSRSPGNPTKPVSADKSGNGNKGE